MARYHKVPTARQLRRVMEAAVVQFEREQTVRREKRNGIYKPDNFTVEF